MIESFNFPPKSWYNFKTRKNENIHFPAGREKEFIPQLDAAQGLYDLLILAGEEPADAMGKVLAASCGEEF